MSGFVGIVNLDGRPVDRVLLGRMTGAMAFRGPDGQDTWADGCAGLGHTVLATTDAASLEQQPVTLDGNTWIVADARVDARAELCQQLDEAGQAVSRAASSAELILRAYLAWGEACVEHLLGDFAFVVWDGSRRRLFAGRDQLGVKSLFYAAVGRTVVLSNTIDCVRLHPAVSDRLNDLAVADFLLFELNHDTTTTVYADIRRVPPAHAAVWSDTSATVTRYWTLPVDEPVFYRRPGDYLDRFAELIDAAVSDRLTKAKVGVFMSGGIDSSTLAAMSQRVLNRRGVELGVCAFTTTVPGFDRDEVDFARLVADHLRIPISIRERGAQAYDPHWDTREVHTASPQRDVPTLLADRVAYGEMSQHSPVAFYGEGPDNALQYEWRAYFRYLRRGGRYTRLAGDVARHVRHHRRLPLQSLVPRLLRASRERQAWDVSYPAWVNPDLDRRLGLRDRWERFSFLQPAAIEHPVRPTAYASFSGPEWEHLCRGWDAEETRAPLDVRHPYLDLRVLRYLLSVPAVPWCREKHLIRRAMRPELPEAALRRPKQGLTGDPDYAVARERGLPMFVPEPELLPFVVPERVPDVSRSSMIQFRADFRPRALNHWLKNRRSTERSGSTEIEHDTAHV